MKNKLFLFGLLIMGATLRGVAEPIYDLTLLKDHNYARGIYFTDQSWLIELLKKVTHSAAAPRRYLHAVLKTFTNVIKGTDCITTDSFIITLQFLVDFLPPYMQSRDYNSYIQATLESD